MQNKSRAFFAVGDFFGAHCTCPSVQSSNTKQQQQVWHMSCNEYTLYEKHYAEIIIFLNTY
jgi:hypothetical protein